MPNIGWTRQQLIIALALYCQMPFGKLHSKNPEIIKFAKLIGRTPSALAMKMSNIASLDPAVTVTGRAGLPGASAADREIWNEAQQDWEKFAGEAENLIKKLIPELGQSSEEAQSEVSEEDYSSDDRIASTKVRNGQDFFRKAVLSAYNFKCCITGLSIPRLLVASHIVPWRHDASNRLNPMNGLALSMLHDKAFDLGIITINEDLTIRVSKKVSAIGDNFYRESLSFYDGKSVAKSEKFSPRSEFLQHHRENVFEKWKGII